MIAIAFAQTVAMWAVVYICRLWPAVVPSWLILALMIVCMLAGGITVGRMTERSWRGGAAVGVLSALLNMMILGSLLSGGRPNQIVPSALLWIPGSLVAGGCVGAIGAAAGRRVERPDRPTVNWTSLLARVAVVACLLLLAAGGLVTSKEAGLAVVDWPTSFGYNMFLYPLSRMTGGIYYEHAHRLLGSLLGLTVIVLAVHLWRSEPRQWLKWVGLAVLLLVVLQGVLGGLRVTGHLTWSTLRADMAPSIRLAAVHGILGQVIFAMLAAIATSTSTGWRTAPVAAPGPYAETDRTLGAALVALLVVQLILGAIVRHTYARLTIHIALAVFVTLVALACGLRSWGLYSQSIVRRRGLWLIGLAAAQVVLGIAALITTGAMTFHKPPPLVEVVFATAHQAVGAVLLAWAVSLSMWHYRLATHAGGSRG
jgi:cytochrome c oxidase assembly protein subunit 15